MGTTLSRDHAKLPFGYTHARKDHSFNTSSVSRKRLAPRLLRTPDTTSVTPFPIQDGTSSVASIPEMVSQPLPLSTSVHLYESLSSQSANGSNTSHNHSESVHYHHTVPESGTGAGSAAIFSTSPVPESDINETAARTPSIRVRTTVASRTAVGATVTTTTIAATRSASSQANTVHAQHRSMDQAAQITTLSTPASPGSSVLSTSPGQVQTDIVTATITSTEPSTVQNQKSMQLSRTQIGQESEMDVISTLRITDQPNQNPYNFFSSSCQSSHPEPQPHLHRPPMLTKQDSIALFVSGSQLLEMQEQSQKSDEIQMRSTQNNRTIRPDFRAHPSSKRTLSYEVKMTERELQRLQEEDEEFSESWDANTLHLENCRGGETDSILDEELEHLSPIPFSELPSLTNIGLCSHGIVRLSSNIRLLASATCVQICCNELSRVPAEIGFLRNLTLLDLSKNRLTRLPESIMHLTKLVDLKLSYNQLESLPAGIGGLVKLAALSLDDNRLESLPSQIGLIKGLVNLDLSNNPITVLPAEVGKLQFLRRLNLDGCPLVKKFEHQPLHSPPTLLELAARVMVRHDVPTPPMVPQHLKSYLKSARACSFCDGPYFDSWVKRGKMIEKNEMFIPLEYTLCQPHWNTEMERVKLLFCKRPITSPPLKSPTPSTQSSSSTENNNNRKKSEAKKQPNRTLDSLPTLEAEYQSSLQSDFSTTTTAVTTPASEVPPSLSTAASSLTRPRNRKYASEGGDRERPLSTIGNRLSMLLSPKADKRERPASANRTSSLPVMATASSSASSSMAASSATTLLSSPLSSPSSPFTGPSSSQTATVGSLVSSTPVSEDIISNSSASGILRPTTRRTPTSSLLARAAFKLKRPLSMGSSAFEPIGIPSNPPTSTE